MNTEDKSISCSARSEACLINNAIIVSHTDAKWNWFMGHDWLSQNHRIGETVTLGTVFSPHYSAFSIESILALSQLDPLKFDIFMCNSDSFTNYVHGFWADLWLLYTRFKVECKKDWIPEEEWFDLPKQRCVALSDFGKDMFFGRWVYVSW